MNKDINEWILDEGVEPLHELYNKKGEIIFLTDFLEKHLKEQLILTDVSHQREQLQKIENIKSFEWGVNPVDNEDRMCELLKLL